MPNKAETYVHIFPMTVKPADARKTLDDEIEVRGLKPTKPPEVEVAYDILGNEVQLVVFKAFDTA